MGPFDFLMPNAEQQVLQAQRAQLQEQLRQSGAVVNQAAARGATNPVALAAATSRAMQGTRAANAGQFAQQIMAAREADRQQAGRLVGGLLGTAGSALAMAIPGAGQAAAPAAQMLGQGLGGEIGKPKPQAVPAAPPMPGAGSVPGMAHMTISPQEVRQFSPPPMQNPYAQAAVQQAQPPAAPTTPTQQTPAWGADERRRRHPALDLPPTRMY